MILPPLARSTESAVIIPHFVPPVEGELLPHAILPDHRCQPCRSREPRLIPGIETLDTGSSFLAAHHAAPRPCVPRQDLWVQ